MHVLFIPAWFTENGLDNVPFIQEQAENLAARGMKVSVLIFLFNGQRKAPFSWTLNDVHYIAVNHAKVFPLSIRLGASLQLWWMTRQVKQRMAAHIRTHGKFDIIHFHSILNNMTPTLGRALSRQYGIPYVITEHYTSFEEAAGIMFAPFRTVEWMKEMVKAAAARISVSAYSARMHEAYFQVPYQVVYNSVQPQFMEGLTVRTWKPGDPFTLISIGRLTERKGFQPLIEAFARVFPAQPEVQLQIVGEGELEADLRAQISRLGLDGRVHILGHQSREQIRARIDAAEALVSASEMETFGMTLLESILRGRPVLATRSGGPEELLNERNGILCAVRDAEDMARALRELYDRYPQFDHAAIAADARDRFSDERISGTLRSIYETAIRQHKS